MQEAGWWVCDYAANPDRMLLDLETEVQTLHLRTRRSVRGFQNTPRKPTRLQTHIHRWCIHGKSAAEFHRFHIDNRRQDACTWYAPRDTTDLRQQKYWLDRATDTSVCNQSRGDCLVHRLAKQNIDST